jgi:ATP-dependent Lon protease
MNLPDSLPIYRCGNMVLPGVVIPITAGRDKSIKLINDANAAGKIIGLWLKR